MVDKDKSEDLFREYLSRRESGEDVKPEEYYKKYPELEADLRNLLSRLSEKHQEQKEIGDTPAKPPRIFGDFKIIKEIGRGGMGTVYETEQISLRRKVALKFLSPHLRLSDDAVQKFKREAEAGGRHNHPGIVAIYAIGEYEGVHYIAQELVQGGFSLADKLDELKEKGEQPLGYFREVAELIAKIADALEHAHQRGVIHRDIKPSNILLDPEGRPKVTDFGLAKVEDALALSRTGDFAGTPFYMSPEQAEGKEVTVQSDIYSIGIVIYEMATGKKPFSGENAHAVTSRIMRGKYPSPLWASPYHSMRLASIIQRAMSKSLNRRYAHAGQMGKDLGRFIGLKKIVRGGEDLADLLGSIEQEQRATTIVRKTDRKQKPVKKKKRKTKSKKKTFFVFLILLAILAFLVYYLIQIVT